MPRPTASPRSTSVGPWGRAGRPALRGRVAVVLAMALALTACASGDDDAGGEAPAGSTTVTTVSTTTTVAGPTPDELAAATCAAQRVRGRLRVADPELNEISGLAWLSSGLWAHNDSGDSARMFRIGADGSTEAVVAFEGVEAVDWEDMASGGPDSGELFVGDIGDNAATRAEVVVHRIVLSDPAVAGEVTVPADAGQAITLRYPDGPRDAETLIVDPRTRDLIVVHKVFGGDSELYVAPESDWSDGEATLAAAGTVSLGRLPIDALTAGDITPDGSVVALRTYAGILVFARQDDETVAEALAGGEPCDAPAAIEVQGEAIAFTPEGYTTISEGDRPRINRFAVTAPGGP